MIGRRAEFVQSGLQSWKLLNTRDQNDVEVEVKGLRCGIFRVNPALQVEKVKGEIVV